MARPDAFLHDPSRRHLLQQAAAVGTLAAVAPHALAQADDLAPYRSAKINWKQAEGESLTVAVIPASYFENLITLAPQFEALTGVKLRFEKVPPGQIRQKALLDLSTRFGEKVDEGVRVAHDLTQEELAQLVGASRETVNKALADFAARGWVRREGRAVVLLDIDRLERRAR